MKRCSQRRGGGTQRHGARGYVLVSTLVMLALMTLMAQRFANRIDQLREQSSGLTAYADGLVLAQNARARTMFKLVTSYPSTGGFVGRDGTMLPADGRTIDLGEGVTVAVQDLRGLASLNLPDNALLTNLLVAAGLPRQASAHLLDSLADYQDTDSLSRLNGAEANTYAEKGMLPPRNGWLASPQELKQVVGWVSYPDVVERFIPWVSSRLDGVLNPNTAPREVLQAKLPQATPAQVDAIIQRRQLRPIDSAAQLRDLVGTALDDEDTAFFVGNTFQVTVRAASLPLAYTYNVMLTPASDATPWVILDSRTVPAAKATPTAEAKSASAVNG